MLALLQNIIYLRCKFSTHTEYKVDVLDQRMAFHQLVIQGPGSFHLFCSVTFKEWLTFPGCQHPPSRQEKRICRITSGKLLWARSGSGSHHFYSHFDGCNSDMWPPLTRKGSGKLSYTPANKGKELW